MERARRILHGCTFRRFINYAVSDLRIKKEKQKLGNNIFERCAKIFIAGRKAQ
jgi:hypothetical protein